MPFPALSPAEARYVAIGGGALLAAGAALLLWPTAPRTLVVGAATDMIGVTDARAFWRDVLPPGTPESSYPKDWCGAFVLWTLHQAGLGKDILWEFGPPNYGFLYRLPHTSTPQPGDIAYFDTNQHHALVTDVGLIGGRLGLLNGNGTGGAVTGSTIAPSQAAGFYSIQPLIDEAKGSVLPWLACGTLLAGGAAYALLPGR